MNIVKAVKLLYDKKAQAITSWGLKRKCSVISTMALYTGQSIKSNILVKSTKGDDVIEYWCPTTEDILDNSWEGIK